MNVELNQVEFTYLGKEYIMYYMPDKMTDSEALAECEGFGCGTERSDLSPYYLIIQKSKAPIMGRIRDNISQYACEELLDEENWK